MYGRLWDNLIMLGTNMYYGSAKRQLEPLLMWSLLSTLSSKVEKWLWVCHSLSTICVCTNTLLECWYNFRANTGKIFPLPSEPCCLLRLVLFQLVFLICIPFKCSRVPRDGTIFYKQILGTNMIFVVTRISLYLELDYSSEQQERKMVMVLWLGLLEIWLTSSC